MKLITEYLDNTTEIHVIEEANGKKNLYIEGIFMQADRRNGNGRIYPTSVLASQVNEYNSKYVVTKRAIGELNHPPTPSVNPERASHLITELRQEGSDFIGKARVLDTPMGNIVRGLIEGGVQLGVSSRGLGSVKKNSRGIDEVQSDFKLLCVDVVSDPSAPDAFVNGIMEGHEWVMAGGSIVERNIEEAKKKIMKTPRRRLEEAKLEVFANIIKGL